MKKYLTIIFVFVLGMFLASCTTSSKFEQSNTRQVASSEGNEDSAAACFQIHDAIGSIIRLREYPPLSEAHLRRIMPLSNSLSTNDLFFCMLILKYLADSHRR